MCGGVIDADSQAVELVQVDRFILNRTLVEIEGKTGTFHELCVEFAGRNWRRHETTPTSGFSRAAPRSV